MKFPIHNRFVLIGEIALTIVSVMGQLVRFLDLAEDLIQLSCLEPHRDIEITYSIRPGEKLTEELWDEVTPLV